jgi:hypothetical protein
MDRAGKFLIHTIDKALQKAPVSQAVYVDHKQCEYGLDEQE